MMAHDVQRQLMKDIEKSPFIGLIADGTTDVHGREQLSVSVRCAVNLEVHELFLGMYNLQSTAANSIETALLDVLLRLNIPIDKLRGYSFDGASNMSGNLNGVKAKLAIKQPISGYFHCANHSLDLALQEVASEVDYCQRFTRISKRMCKYISRIGKKKASTSNNF